MKQKRRGVYNVIQRNRPQLRKGADNRALKDPAGNYIVDGHLDEVVIANVGGPTAEMLRKADADYHGLMCRDFQVAFSGDTFQAWDLKPVMDASGGSNPTPLTENDMALFARKHDLDAYMKPPSYEEAQRIVQLYGQNSGASPNASGGFVPAPAGGTPQGNGMAAPAGNGFMAPAPGASIPSGAFGAAQAPPPPAQPAPAPAPVQQQPMAPAQPQPQPPVQQQPPAPAPVPVQQ